MARDETVLEPAKQVGGDGADAETKAIHQMTNALAPLTDEARLRVLWWVRSYFRLESYRG